MNMFDIWNAKEDLAEEVYSRDNYIIMDNIFQDSKLCYIFFSSNNIWFPNTETAFRRSFIENDYYEWKSYSNLPARKIIFMRDIYKSWYVTGINRYMDSIDKVIVFLKKETEGLKVITVGSSAGGYMAALAASLLDAEHCLCCSAQFDLTVEEALGRNPLLKAYLQDDRNKYYKIADIIKKSNTVIYYIMPAHVSIDCKQLNTICTVNNVKILKMASHHHGVPILKGTLPILLRMDVDALNTLFEANKDKITGKIALSIKLCGIWKTCKFLKEEAMKQVYKRLRRN